MRRIDFSRAGTGAYPVVAAAEPAPGPGQVRIRAEAAGAGLGLVRMLRAGTAGEDGPGGEVVGRVAAVGPDVTDIAVGERVGGVVFSGLYAESVLASPAMLARVPDDVSTDDAVALVRGGLVALSVLRTGLKPHGEYVAAEAGADARGRSVLVTAAGSGVGHLVVQLARALGAARVVAAVGSAGKPRSCATAAPTRWSPTTRRPGATRWTWSSTASAAISSGGASTRWPRTDGWSPTAPAVGPSTRAPCWPSTRS